MAGLVPAIHALFRGRKDVDARHKRAFTPVFDGLWPGMTSNNGSLDPPGRIPYTRHSWWSGRLAQRESTPFTRVGS